MLEPLVNKWVSSMQRGFLQGRSMLSNVVDIDYHAMRVSLKHPQGAIVLFDFAAAFPSLSQEYMWRVLTHIGVPPHVLRALQRFYINNMHFIQVKSAIYPSLTATSGVSPLLFAAVVDPLLQRLQANLPDCVLRAFADDTAAVVPEFAKSAPSIMSIYQDFGKISNLQLNVKKTILVPLWESSQSSVRRWLQDDLPAWSGVGIEWSARCLGFDIGPCQNRKAWSRARSEFRKRVEAWSSLKLGMHLNSQVYRSFCLSVYSFLWQLEDPPEDVL